MTMKKRILAFALCALTIFSAVPVTPMGSLYAIEASAADITELEKVYALVPDKANWGNYVDTTELGYCCDYVEAILATPDTFSQEKIDEYTQKLRTAIDNLKLHTTGIALNKSEITDALVGKTYTLKATLTPSDAGDEIVWTSSNSSVVSVEKNGDGEALLTIKAYSANAVVVTASSYNYSASCTVNTANPVGSVSVSKSEISLFESESVTLKATANGKDSGAAATGTLFYTWHSSNENVATVSDSGAVTAVSQGSCAVTVTVKDSFGYEAQASCTVTVKETIRITSLTLNATLTSSSIYLNVNETQTISVGIYPTNASIKTLTWKSSDTSVATVSGASVSSSTASVKITALATGKTKITYSATDGSGLSGYFYVQVRPLITSLSLSDSFKVISPTSSGEAITATITPEDAGNQALLWTSSDSSVCTVSATGELYPKSSGVCTITAKTNDGTEISKSCTVRVVEKTSSVKLNKSSLSLNTGDKSTLKATVTASDGTTYNDVKWKSGNTSVATVSDSGVVTAVGPGSVVITATAYDDSVKRAVCVVTVEQPVTGVSLPSTANVALDGSKTLTATITPSNATNQNVTWKSSNTSVATVSESGKVSGKKTGTAIITCTTEDGAYTAKCTVTVVIVPTSIALNKTSATLNSGDTLTLSVTFTPSNASIKTVKWTSSDTSVATVSSSGKVTAKAGGTCTITAKSTSGSKTATCKITVKQEVSDVSLDTSAFSIYTTGTKTLKATVVPSTASNQSVTWTSSNTNVATVSSAGKVTGINPGTCTITVTTKDGGYKSTCTVTVYKKVSVTSLTLDSSKLTMNKGDSTTILATITPANASEKTITWSSTDTTVATVSSKGVVTAKATGTTVITALTKDGNFLQQCKVTVEQAVTSVKLSATEVKLSVGKTKTLKATVSPSDATNKKVTWSSSNEKVATVSSSGVVTAKAKGTATITAKTKDGGYVAVCTIETYIGVTGVTINSDSVKLPKGETTVLTATVKPSNAENKGITWTSSDTKIATVSASGKVTGKKTGTVTITATTSDGAKTDTCTLEVVQLVTKVSLNVTKLSLETGKSKTITASVSPSTASDKTVKFSSSNKKVATISSKGVLKAVGPGTATITVKSTDGNAKATFVVTVTQPVESISVTPKKSNVKIGAMLALTANFKPENATNQRVTWQSSDTSIATVDSNGVVKGIKKGKVTITCTSTSGGHKATATITVIKGVKSVSLNKTSLKLNVGRTSTLAATIKPTSASIKTVTWSSSNKDVATVDSNGKITAKAPGYAKITVKTKDGGFKAYCEVLVIQPVTGVKLNKSSATMEKESKLTLKATVKPSNASDISVKWSSSDKSVAKVSSAGVVTAVDSGTAIITAKTNDGSYKATCKITVIRSVSGVKLNVTSKKLYLGSTYTLKATVSPSDADNKKVTWSSSDTSIAKVSSNGTVTPVKPGTATITVKTKDGSFKAKCTVTILRAVTSIKLNKSAVSVNVGDSYTLKATLSPSNATNKTVTWTSSNKAVATVSSSGVVKAVKRGTATITAKTENGLTKTCKITVLQPVTGVNLNKSELTVYAGDKTTLVATILPSNANTTDVTWSVSSSSILSVTSKGVVTALKAGKATVTVKTKDGGYTAKCTFNVLQHVEKIELDKQEVIIKDGDTAKLTATISPANATDKTFKFTSSDESVVTVDADGNLTSVGIGEATIKVTSNENNKSASSTVKVVERATGVELNESTRTIFVGESFVLTANVLPESAYYRTVTWQSSDESVATVDEKGVVTAVKSGTCDITSTTDDGSFTASCSVTALQKALGIEISETKKTVLVGESFTLSANVCPDDCYNKNFTWSIDSEEFAKIDENGVVTTFAPGTAVITATSEDGSFTASCTLTIHQSVTDLTLDTDSVKLYKGETQRIVATVLPENASDKTLIWQSTDENVATVDSTGLITAVGKGTAIITATSKDNSNVVRSCMVECALKVESIVTEKEEYYVVEGGSANIGAYAYPTNAEDTSITYASNDDAIARVDENGNITAVSKGEAIITIASVAQKDITKQVKIIVTRAVTGVEISNTELTLSKNETATLSATVKPNSADFKDVVWTSSNEKIATVKDGVVTAIAGGEATITVTTVDGSFTAECKLTVIELPESVVFSDVKYIVGVGKTNTLKVTVLPETANDKSVTFESDNTDVVTVDENGVITGIKKGTANITVKTVSGNAYNVATVECVQLPERITLQNEKEYLFVGDSTALISEVLPEDTNDKTLEWISSDETVATVDENGVITAISAGTAEITAKSTHCDVLCKINVEVRQQATSITLNASEKILNKKDTFTLEAIVGPENTYDKTVAWLSSDENVVSVENGVVTANGVGTAIVTAASSNEDVKAECRFTVIRFVDEITLDQNELTLQKGAEYQLAVSILPEDATENKLTWTSSDESVATVDENGKITAVKGGYATIKAETTTEGVFAVCKVTVDVRSEKVELSHKVHSLYCGETVTLSATVTPEDTTDKSIIWLSSDESVATVQGGVVTAVDVGTAVIKAQMADGDAFAACEITVLKHVESISFASNEQTAYIGRTVTLKPVVLPENATNKNLIWLSSDERVATVQNGVVKALSEGTTIITAESEDGGYKDFVIVSVKQGIDKVTLNVYEKMINKNESFTLTATVSPENADDKTVLWYSSDESVALVQNGVVTATDKAGTAVIRATSIDSSDIYAECTVTVKQEVTEITLSKPENGLRVGEKLKLTATILPENANIKDLKWSSSNEEVAVVSENGEITALKPGTAEIVALNEDSGISAKCEVKVYLEIESMEIETFTIDCETSKSVVISISPVDHDEGFIFKSSDESLFTVDEYGVVTAKDKPGKAILTVTSTISGTEKSIEVEVIKRVESITIDTVVPENDILVGDSLQLEYTIAPSNATNANVVFSTSDVAVANVSDTGYVTFTGAGEVTITVTTLDKSLEAEITFTVISNE